MRLHVYAHSHVHYSRRNAQLLYLSISQGSIGVLVFFHHITGGVRVSGGGDGEGGVGGGKSAVLSQEPSFLVLSHPSLWFCLLPFETQRRPALARKTAGGVILRYKTVMWETCGSCRAGGGGECASAAPSWHELILTMPFPKRRKKE